MEQDDEGVGRRTGFEDVVGEMAVGAEIYLARRDAGGKGEGSWVGCCCKVCHYT